MSASIFEKGSSNNRIFGDVAKALARATLCCSPPDSSSGIYYSIFLN